MRCSKLIAYLGTASAALPITALAISQLTVTSVSLSYWKISQPFPCVGNCASQRSASELPPGSAVPKSLPSPQPKEVPRASEAGATKPSTMVKAALALGVGVCLSRPRERDRP